MSFLVGWSRRSAYEILRNVDFHGLVVEIEGSREFTHAVRPVVKKKVVSPPDRNVSFGELRAQSTYLPFTRSSSPFTMIDLAPSPRPPVTSSKSGQSGTGDEKDVSGHGNGRARVVGGGW